VAAGIVVNSFFAYTKQSAIGTAILLAATAAYFGVQDRRGSEHALSEIAYMSWAKALPPARINLARSGSRPAALAAQARAARPGDQPARGYGHLPLRRAIGAATASTGPGPAPLRRRQPGQLGGLRHRPRGRAAGGRSDRGAARLRALAPHPSSPGCRLVRLERRFEDGFGIDLQRFAALVNRKTRLAIVSNLHNPRECGSSRRR